MNRLRTSCRHSALPRSRSGAAIYIAVVFNALLVGLLGLSALSIVRIERRQSIACSDQMIARENASSAVAAALARIKADPGWRTTFTHNVESAPFDLAAGSASFRLVDLVDTSLGNNPRHAVAIDGIGRSGNAVWVERVEAFQPEVPLPTLACAIHSQGRLRVDPNCSLTLINGVASTNGELAVHGALYGGAHCSTRTGGGTVVGGVTTGMTPRESPASSLFAAYRDLAVTIPYVGGLNRHFLGPGVNTYTAASSENGIYYINAGSSMLTIASSRIYGTLVVKGNVTINDFVFLQFLKREAPVLIVDGNLTVQCDSTQFLSESAESRNFNPLTSLFQGTGDLDTTDVYPSEIWGVVHVLGNLTISDTSRIVGVVLVEGDTRINDHATVQCDPTMFFSPPTGYWTAVPGPLVAKPGKWQRAAIQ